MTSPPRWAPHEHASYDEWLEPACATELHCLLAASEEERAAFLTDPRDVHRKLYAPLAPDGFTEYAGTYRGTKCTTLEKRQVSAKQVGDCAGPATFIAPERVEQSLGTYIAAVDQLLDKKLRGNGPNQFSALVKVFYTFGLIHPFLDGNGHVQRIVFAVAASMCDRITLSRTWTIHQRPYDIEMAEAFNKGGNTGARLQQVASVLRPYVCIA